MSKVNVRKRKSGKVVISTEIPVTKEMIKQYENGDDSEIIGAMIQAKENIEIATADNLFKKFLKSQTNGEKQNNVGKRTN